MVIKKTHSPGIRHKVSAIPLTLTMLFPWIVSLFMQEPASGSIASFGAYMLVISFSVLPVKKPLQQVLIAAGIMIFFATLGFSAPGGSIYFSCSPSWQPWHKAWLNFAEGIYACRSHWLPLFFFWRTGNHPLKRLVSIFFPLVLVACGLSPLF